MFPHEYHIGHDHPTLNQQTRRLRGADDQTITVYPEIAQFFTTECWIGRNIYCRDETSRSVQSHQSSIGNQLIKQTCTLSLARWWLTIGLREKEHDPAAG